MESNVNVVLANKMDEWGYDNKSNLIAEGELTVTITLHEYRELVKQNAISDSKISELRDENYDLKKKVDELEKKNNKLAEDYAELMKIKCEQLEERLDEVTEE